jgi:hypothetical protein
MKKTKTNNSSRSLQRAKAAPAKKKAVKSKPVKPQEAPAKASKAKVVPKAEPKPAGPQKGQQSTVAVNPETIAQLQAEFKESDHKAKIAQKSLALGLIDQSLANDAHFKAGAAKLALLQAGGKIGKGGSRRGQMSGLEAAYRVLCESDEPMRANAITDEAMKKRYWEPEGATPDATLSSAIIREINTKGENSRFVRVGKGLFAIMKTQQND